MPHESSSLSVLGAVAASDEVDPELVELPHPLRAGRTWALVVLALGALSALAMTLTLRHDVAYAVAPSEPASLGDLRGVDDTSLAENDNRFVRASGLLGAAGGIRYERPFQTDTFRALPVAGRTDLWVEVRVPFGSETGRWEPPRSFAGHLERLSAAGPTHRGLRAAIEEVAQAGIPKGAWLLVDGEDPPHVRWALALASLFVGFAVWNAFALARVLRRVA